MTTLYFLIAVCWLGSSGTNRTLHGTRAKSQNIVVDRRVILADDIAGNILWHLQRDNTNTKFQPTLEVCYCNDYQCRYFAPSAKGGEVYLVLASKCPVSPSL